MLTKLTKDLGFFICLSDINEVKKRKLNTKSYSAAENIQRCDFAVGVKLMNDTNNNARVKTPKMA